MMTTTIIGTSVPTVTRTGIMTEIIIGIVTGSETVIMTVGENASTSAGSESIAAGGRETTMTVTMATTAARSTTVIPIAIPAVMVFPAAVMAAQSMAGVTTWAITSAIRTASTGLARIWQRTNRSTPILG